MPTSTNILIPVSTAVGANRVLLFKSCISEPHLCKATSVLYRNIFPFAQSSPKQTVQQLTHELLSHTPVLCPQMVNMICLSFSAPMRSTPGKTLSYVQCIHIEHIANMTCYFIDVHCLSSLMFHSRY